MGIVAHDGLVKLIRRAVSLPRADLRHLLHRGHRHAVACADKSVGKIGGSGAGAISEGLSPPWAPDYQPCRDSRMVQPGRCMYVDLAPFDTGKIAAFRRRCWREVEHLPDFLMNVTPAVEPARSP